MKRGVLVALVLFLLLSAALLFSARDLIFGILPLVRPAPKIVEGDPLPFSVPNGFAVSLYARDLPGVRVIARGPGAAMYASLPGEGSIIALLDENGDQKIEKTEIILSGLHAPHGFLILCAPENENDCSLYVAEEHALSVYTFDAKMRSTTNRKKLVDLPSDGGHSTRSLLQHPDGRHLLIAIGSKCNACEEKDPRRASIQALDLSTNALVPFATGLRNTVFMTIHPVTGEMWGADMGRDLLGDDLPPDEINKIREGGWYGWPYCYGKNILDTTVRQDVSACESGTPSHVDIPAHSAPLGVAFIPEEGWPEEYWFDLLVAYHGSWNRSVPTGYKIVRIELSDTGAPSGRVSDFMTGFMNESGVVGRPVGLLADPGGTVYVSDDRAGVIYRIFRTSQ